MRSLSPLQPIVHVFDYTCVGVTLDFRIPRSFIGKMAPILYTENLN